MSRTDRPLEHCSDSTSANRRSSRWLRFAMVAVLSLALGVTSVGRASAAAYSPGLFLGNGEADGCSNSSTQVVGRGFAADTQYTLTASVGTLRSSTAASDSTGVFGIGLVISRDIAPGTPVVVKAYLPEAPADPVAQLDFTVEGPSEQFPGLYLWQPVLVGGLIHVAGTCLWPGEQVAISSAQVQLSPMSTTATRDGAVDQYTQVLSIRKSGQAFITLTGLTSGLHVSFGFTDSDSTLNAGSALDAQWGGELVSSSTHYQLFVYDNGIIVGRVPSAHPQTSTYDPVWQSNPSQVVTGARAGVLAMQTNGNLVLYNGSHSVWSSGTAGTGSNNRAVMLDNGDLVIYTAAGKAVWTSRSGRVKPTTPTLTAGHTLSRGQLLSNGKYHAELLTDGNFVVYGHSVWQSHTAGRGGTLLDLQGDGNLVLFTAAGRSVWSSGTAGSHATQLVLQSNGDLVLFTAAGRSVWSTHTF